MTWFSQPFTAARVRYFDERDSDAAVQWILNGSKPEFVGVADLEAMPG